jgi:hypothetical protein
MNPANRQRLLLILAGTVIALLLGDRMILQPLLRGWKERAARIAELEKQITQGKALLDRADSLQTRWHLMETNTLPAEISGAESQLLRGFERWSAGTSITISSLQPQWKRNEDDYMTLEYRADAAGTTESLARFLYNLEKDPMGLRVESMQLISRDDRGQNISLGLVVSGLLLNPPEE